ncbi:MAG: type IX secretion system sortase PorU [Bacteroidetes bacterium]|nr:type IX secretion system sortase PorU [Bacteroidota bacterium]
MRRNSYHIVLRYVAAVCAVALVVSYARGQQLAARSSYEVLSASQSEIVLHIHPDFSTRRVSDGVTGERYLAISYSGSTVGTIPIGSPAEAYLDLGVLVPGADATPSVEIVSMQTESLVGVLAPVPVQTVSNGTAELRYVRTPEAYGSRDVVAYATANAPQVLRTAWRSALVIHPVRYELDNATITLVKDMVVRIRIPGASHVVSTATYSPLESQYFETMCINGDNTSLYRSAVAQLASGLPMNAISMKSVPTAANEQWFALTTADDGIYHITADDLSKAGATNIDANTVAVYGYGAQALPESVDSLTGELHECSISVVTKPDGSLSEIRFYAPGPAKWAYQHNSGGSRIYGMYHVMNPYSTAGHFLLKVGGAPATKRVLSVPDQIDASVTVTTASSVQTVALHEAEMRFEHPNISREFLGESIPIGRDVSIGLPSLPGYLPDSTVIRPAFNSRTTARHNFSVKINGTSFPDVVDYGTISDLNEGPYTTRRWDPEFLLPAGFGTPNTVTLQATANETAASFWLNFIEVFYRHSLSLSNGQIPFYLTEDASAYRYDFTDAPNGSVWDVTDLTNIRELATASGSSITATIAGPATTMRRFYAFTSSQLKSVTLASIPTPTLRSTVCTQGAEEIIIVPSSMLEQANKLAKIRRTGGQATGPITVSVVTLEDIYREFGYGANDATAIRDFIRAAERRSAVSGGTVPLYVCLFGAGHVDYQNRMTQIPVNIPVYETADVVTVGGFRASEPEYDSDDGFFGDFNPSPNSTVDMAIGRIAVLNATEAEEYIAKVAKYETSSDEGPWRSRIAFICDDRYHTDLKSPDGLDHLNDTQNEVYQTPDRFLFEKIYGQAYPNIFTSAGRRKPEMEAAIVDAFNSGAAIISYVGHGNPTVWADESILSVPSTINKFTNFNRLAYVTTATCDFSQYDDYAAKISGGVQMLKKPDGGAIGLLATCRSVAGGDSFAPQFYRSLFSQPCDSRVSTTPVGVSYVYARATSSYTPNRNKYFLLGDPAQRVLLPRQYMVIDSINGQSYDKNAASPVQISALSLVALSGHVSNICDGSDIDETFNGSTAVTLYDAPSFVSYTTTFIETPPITDTWQVDGPILYTGGATVTNGRFHTSFVVSKDIKFDTSHAKISMLAYSDDFRSALGNAKNIRVFGIDTARIDADSQGPALKAFIGTRAFHSGDVVPVNSVLIVDVKDLSGLNTSTSSIGHSFVGWVDDSTSGMIDLADGYVASSDDFTNGTSTERVSLPLGHHRMNIRAFDAAGNPAFTSIDFVAKGDAPYRLFNVTVTPHPVRSTATFTLEQPAAPESPVDVTLDLYSAIAQHVRTIEVPSISSNVITIPFDGNDQSGSPLADGMYLFRMTATQRLSGVTTTSGGTFIITRDH